MYNYSQVVMKQNVYCLNYFKKIKNVQACYNCLEISFKTAIGIISRYEQLSKSYKVVTTISSLSNCLHSDESIFY